MSFSARKSSALAAEHHTKTARAIKQRMFFSVECIFRLTCPDFGLYFISQTASNEASRKRERPNGSLPSQSPEEHLGTHDRRAALQRSGVRARREDQGSRQARSERNLQNPQRQAMEFLTIPPRFGGVAHRRD